MWSRAHNSAYAQLDFGSILYLGSSASSIPAWTILDRDCDDHLDAFWSTGLAVDECVAWHWSLGWRRDPDHRNHGAMVGQSEAYADQNETDHAALALGVADGRVEAEVDA